MNANAYECLTASQSLAVGCWRADGTFFEVSEALIALLGCPREDLDAGKVRWQDLTPPEYEPLDANALVEINLHGKCSPFEKEYIRSDGSRMPVLIAAAAFGNGVRDSGSFYAVDLRHRKQLNAARQADPEEAFRLTARQRLIGLLSSHGVPQKQIASVLDMGLRTVEFERQRTTAILGLHTRTATLWAVSNRQNLTDSLAGTGLITPAIEQLLRG